MLRRLLTLVTLATLLVSAVPSQPSALVTSVSLSVLPTVSPGPDIPRDQDVTMRFRSFSGPIVVRQTVAQARAWALVYLYNRYGARSKIVWRGCDNKSQPVRIAAYLAQFSALSCVIQGESKWNPGAVNKHSGACGFLQSNPCRKMGIVDYPNRPLDQMKWAMSYTIRRYGSPLREQQSRAFRGWM